MVFLAIHSVQNVQNDRTNLLGLKISRNTQYGMTSYLYIMIPVSFFCRKNAPPGTRTHDHQLPPGAETPPKNQEFSRTRPNEFFSRRDRCRSIRIQKLDRSSNFRQNRSGQSLYLVADGRTNGRTNERTDATAKSTHPHARIFQECGTRLLAQKPLPHT